MLWFEKHQLTFKVENSLAKKKKVKELPTSNIEPRYRFDNTAIMILNDNPLIFTLIFSEEHWQYQNNVVLNLICNDKRRFPSLFPFVYNRKAVNDFNASGRSTK